MSHGKDAGAFAMVAVFSLGAVVSGGSMLNGTVATIAAEFPELSITTISLIATINSIIACPVMLVVGLVVGKRIGFKPLAILGCVLFTVGGLIPAFVTGSFAAIMASRVIVAIGVGSLMSLPMSLAFRLFEGNRAQQVQSWYMSINNIILSLLTMLVGVLAAASVNYIWFAHLIGLVTLLIVLFGLPEPAKAEDEAAGGEGAKDGVKARIPAAVWVLVLLSFACNVLVFPVYINTSLIVEGNLWGDAAASGMCVSLVAFGGFFGGLVFSKLYAVTPRWTALISALIAAVGALLMLTASNLYMVAAGAFVSGWGYLQFFCGVTAATGVVAPASRTAISMSLVMIALNVGIFVAPYAVAGLQAVMQTANYQLPFGVMLVLWVVVGAFMSLWFPNNPRKVGTPSD